MSRGLQQPKVLLLTEPGENQQELVSQIEQYYPVEIATALVEPSIGHNYPFDLILVTLIALKKLAGSLSEFRTKSHAHKGLPLVVAVSDVEFISVIAVHLGIAIDDYISLLVDRQVLKSRLMVWIEVCQLRQLAQRLQFYASVQISDMRSPLTSIVGQSELLLNDFDPEGYRDALENMSSEARRVYDCTVDLADLNMVESRFRTDNPEVVSAKQFIEEAAKEKEQEFDKFKKQFSFHNSVPLAAVKGNRYVLTNAIGRCLRGLFQTTVEGGVISIEVKQVVDKWNNSGKEVVHITIKDYLTNPRPDPVSTPNFQAAPNYKSREWSLEHKLYVVKNIIEHHAGRIWIESVRNEEIIIHIVLPVAS